MQATVKWEGPATSMFVCIGSCSVRASSTHFQESQREEVATVICSLSYAEGFNPHISLFCSQPAYRLVRDSCLILPQHSSAGSSTR
jgi:hypothetical protein